MYPIRNILKNIKKCNNCHIDYLSNNAIENGLDGTISEVNIQNIFSIADTDLLCAPR